MPQPAAPRPAGPGVVVHLAGADPDRHAAVLRNIANLRAELDDGSEVELVVHGPRLAAARTAAHTEQLTS